MTRKPEIKDGVPAVRIRAANATEVNTDGRWVVYWMISARRTRFNFGLQRAAGWARHLGKPLLVFEPLRCGYRWASDRLHGFVINGMADNAAACTRRVAYLPYLEPEPGAGRGLLAALAERSAIVVTDDYPTFFLPKMVAAAAAVIPVRLEAVDSNGLLPMAAPEREFKTAYSFRRYLQKNLLAHLRRPPLEDPLADDLPEALPIPAAVSEAWPSQANQVFDGAAVDLGALPIDHSVQPTRLRGGSVAAGAALTGFLDERLGRYGEDRNRPGEEASSGLSPYLHFGHISSHEIFLEIMRRERWSADDVVAPANGRRAGWWGINADAEAFLDQVVTWRELGFNVCSKRADYDRWESLPDWAQRTLTEHVLDTRDHTYTLEEFAAGATHDPLWNAAQNQLVQEGTIHNYLRMLWGKKILEWTSEPREALEVMIELNNRFALDGRDPNSYTGIFWVLGRHDRPWGPERPIFGKVRYMSSANTARKFPVRTYLEKYGEIA
jgi:deoxyribodipyrimidine photo-lyase